MGIAPCPEWCSSCCTGIFQHTWITTAEFIDFPGRKGGWEDCQWASLFFTKSTKIKTCPLCPLRPWATFNCNYPVLIWPFWSKGQRMNMSHFLRLLWTFIFPVCKWKETERWEASRCLEGWARCKLLAATAALPFPCLKSMGLLLQLQRAGAQPERKYSSVFLGIIQAVWCWRGEGTVGSRRGKMPTSAKGLGGEIESKWSISLHTS